MMCEDKEEQQARNNIIKAVREYAQLFHSPKKNYCPGDKISYAGRVYDEEELAALTQAALDFWLTEGNYAAAFEEQIKTYLRIKYVSLTNSGSSANLLAFMALTSPLLRERKIRPGDEVITVAASFPTTVAPVLQYGAVPVFVDISIPSYNLDVTQLDHALSPQSKAVMVAHTLGNPFDIHTVKAFCERNNLWLIEDNCDALGSEYAADGQLKKTGTFGHIGTSSFYPAHHITTGEGGAVYTDDPLLHKIVRSLRDWGRDCCCMGGQDNACGKRFEQQYGRLPNGYDHKYVYSHLGYNLKMTDMQAAIGNAQMDKIAEFTRCRRSNWELLHQLLEKANHLLVLPEPEPDAAPSWFGFLLTVRGQAPFSREDLVRHLEAAGIQTRNLFAGNLTRHPCFDELTEGVDYRIAGTLEQTDIVLKNSFWLGVYPGLLEEEVCYMAAQILAFTTKKETF